MGCTSSKKKGGENKKAGGKSKGPPQHAKGNIDDPYEVGSDQENDGQKVLAIKEKGEEQEAADPGKQLVPYDESGQQAAAKDGDNQA